MTEISYKVGILVRHPNQPDWGPGKVLDVNGAILTVYWRDLREIKRGDAVKRISTLHAPLVLSESQSDPWLDNLPPFENGRLALPRVRWTLEQAVESFRREFPLLFKDPKYRGDEKSGERFYKWRAHELYQALLGNGQGERFVAEGNIREATARALRVVGSVNLLFLQEQLALRDGLNDPRAAQGFFVALFDLLSRPAPDQSLFEIYIDALSSLPAKEGKTSVTKWTTLTILPFLANPGTFMFLKPEVSKRAAETLAFDLRYDSRLNWATYERLVTMSWLLMESLRPLGAVDLIDVQSFVWVTERLASGERNAIS